MKFHRCQKQLFLIILLVISFVIVYQTKKDKTVLNIELNNKIKFTIYNAIPTFSTNGVLCMVLTSEKNILTRGITIWETWGHELEHNIVFACNCSNIIAVKNLLNRNETIPEELSIYKKAAHLPILNINLIEDQTKMGRKVLVVLKDTYDIYKNCSNWYFMVDDDAFIFVDNLKKFTQSKNTSEPYMYGFKFHHLPKPGGHIGKFIILYFINFTKINIFLIKVADLVFY